MPFHLGKPILVMLVLAVVSGGALLLHHGSVDTGLRVWVFAESHRDAYQTVLADSQPSARAPVHLELITMNALNVRLSSLFMSPNSSAQWPDVVEVEINYIPRYLRPPTQEIGFLPLNRYLQKSGWMNRIARNRFTPWMKDGQIFGVPHDVHPVAITYRADLFQEAGIDLSSAVTWADFQDQCLLFQRYWAARSVRYRHAVQLQRSNCEDLVQMLLQRHLSLIDEQGRVRINDPRVAATLAFYAQLVAGPRKIGEPSSNSSELWSQDLIAGNICAMLTPDWKLQQVREYASACAGRLRMIPLPRFGPGDARTSTWGGTMIGIPRHCQRPDEAWKLIEQLCFSPEGLRARFRESAILPPLPEEWNKPMYHQPDPLYRGQDVMGLYAQLAAEIPANYSSPATPLARAELSYVVNRAAAYVDHHGAQGIEAKCQLWLNEAADDIRTRMRQSRFTDDDATH